ncbi:2'-5' RNA ligase family protein [Nonomuraea sp. NEAU-A123]|uniref:2'-5' RNA ligase family protein n=1 Tax=Nonomuraea sp. NEAU-A123 TaxID=2839649 RepID=UPI001BE3DE6C|nr:2'-5' RNA ligase family protein [Nonomuraea sp. NEAU-A123]MBT2234283.1 2'-5' RNA ligase family protein [Nonomuraea sp. NEAU-A123]
MSDGTSGRYRAGETALLAVVKEAEPLAGRWRQRFDTSASAGVPAHVTVLVPFLDIDRIDAVVIDDLGALLGEHSPFTVRFARCRRFPDVLYLAPTPDQPFRTLTEAVAARWPEAPPYGGQFAEIIPHLTVAHGQQAHVYDEVEAALIAGLPVTANVASVSLFVSDGDRWHQHAEFPLRG